MDHFAFIFVDTGYRSLLSSAAGSTGPKQHETIFSPLRKSSLTRILAMSRTPNSANAF